MDRNVPPVANIVDNVKVVPRKGDVDRNVNGHKNLAIVSVVPRKGDVDRNVYFKVRHIRRVMSSPARGTWIEIARATECDRLKTVVPRKGDVDRNTVRSVK